MSTAVAAGLGLAVLAAVFVPLERLFTATPQPILRRALSTDALFYLGQVGVWTGAVASGLTAVAVASAALPLEPLRAAWRTQPWVLQAVEVVVLGDLVVYWGHRLSHAWSPLWRVHRVHHTAERLDWLAAFREHPLDGLYTQLLVNGPALLLGFPVATIAGVAVFRGLWGVFIHSNVRLPLGPLRYLVGAPSLHHWHHDVTVGGRCNFANLFPALDWLFGTLHEPDHEPAAVGVAEPVPRSYVGLLLEPLGLWPSVPRRLVDHAEQAPHRRGADRTPDPGADADPRGDRPGEPRPAPEQRLRRRA